MTYGRNDGQPKSSTYSPIFSKRTNVQKMMWNNPKVDHVNINAQTQFGRFYKVFLKILSGNKIMTDRRTE